jgi:hypothetical protein
MNVLVIASIGAAIAVSYSADLTIQSALFYSVIKSMLAKTIEMLLKWLRKREARCFVTSFTFIQLEPFIQCIHG